MNSPSKIVLDPLSFEAFNALDVLVNGEIGEMSYHIRAAERRQQAAEGERRRLESLREVRRLIDRARPPAYAAAIRAAYARPDVCET
jgi:hypothetical protein